MTYHAVTSWPPRLHTVYGTRFLESFRRHWRGVGLTVVLEESFRGAQLRKGETWLEHAHLGDLEDVMRRDAYAEGSRRNRAKFPKFGAKATALYQAFQAHQEVDWLIWLDADVETTACVDPQWLRTVLPDSRAVSCLRRSEGRTGVESGFVGYNLRHPGSRALLEALGRAYLTGEVLDHEDWGDGEVMADLLPRYLTPEDVHDLSAGIARTHCWPHSALGAKMAHYKGVNRKEAAYGHRDLEHPSKL